MKIIPVDGRKVIDPDTGREVKGEVTVPDNHGFWLRRLADGDVALAADPAKKAKGE